MAKASEWDSPVSAFTLTHRHLPHIEVPGSYYWCTCVTHHRRELSPEERDIVLGAWHFHDATKYDMDAVVIMPDHYHVILKPRQQDDGSALSLRSIFHSINSYTANKIGGTVWQSENSDHIMRNEKDYLEKLSYLIYNPIRAGLVEDPWSYRWLYYRGRA